MSTFHYDYPYIDNDTFYHIPASFASIEEAFARIRENDIIERHNGGPEGGMKTSTRIKKACHETLKIYTKEMFGIFHTEDEECRSKLIKHLKRFLKLLGYCNVQEYLLKMYGDDITSQKWWLVYQHSTYINVDLFTAMIIAYESKYMSNDNRRKALYLVNSTVSEFARIRRITTEEVFFNIKKLISLWRDAEVSEE